MLFDTGKCRTCLQKDEEDDMWGTVPCPDCGLPLIWDDGESAWDNRSLTKEQKARVYSVYESVIGS